MRIISTRLHGFLDYLVAVLVIGTPWIFGFSEFYKPAFILAGTGIAIIAYSFLTDYELGIRRLLPVNMHLLFDFFVGIFLLLAPWIFGFSQSLWKPFIVFGIVSVSASLMTKTSTPERMTLQARLKKTIQKSYKPGP